MPRYLSSKLCFAPTDYLSDPTDGTARLFDLNSEMMEMIALTREAIARSQTLLAEVEARLVRK